MDTVAQGLRVVAACVGFVGGELVRLRDWLEEIAERADPPGLDVRLDGLTPATADGYWGAGAEGADMTEDEGLWVRSEVMRLLSSKLGIPAKTAGQVIVGG